MNPVFQGDRRLGSIDLFARINENKGLSFFSAASRAIETA
jgi:hypothetical protein